MKNNDVQGGQDGNVCQYTADCGWQGHIIFPTPNAQRPTSNVQRPTSNVKRQTSNGSGPVQTSSEVSGRPGQLSEAHSAGDLCLGKAVRQ